MIRKLVKLAVFLLIVNGLYRIAPPTVHYFQFKDAVQELAMLLGVKFKQDARGQFSHSNLFTILNSGGEIVHQHVGLKGEISAAAKVLALAAN